MEWRRAGERVRGQPAGTGRSEEMRLRQRCQRRQPHQARGQVLAHLSPPDSVPVQSEEVSQAADPTLCPGTVTCTPALILFLLPFSSQTHDLCGVIRHLGASMRCVTPPCGLNAYANVFSRRKCVETLTFGWKSYAVKIPRKHMR